MKNQEPPFSFVHLEHMHWSTNFRFSVRLLSILTCQVQKRFGPQNPPPPYRGKCPPLRIMVNHKIDRLRYHTRFEHKGDHIIAQGLTIVPCPNCDQNICHCITKLRCNRN